MSDLVRVVDVTEMAGPLYEAPSEDGPVVVFDWFVVASDATGKSYTYTFACFGRDEERARAHATRVFSRGQIDLRYWTAGDPWEAYHGGMSLEERLAPFGPEWHGERVR